MTLTAKTKVGFGKESSGSWGVKASSFQIIPVNPPTFTKTYENVLDQGLRGIAARDFGPMQRGAGACEATLEGLFYAEELGYFIYGIMGSAGVAGSAPWTHTFALGDEVPSFSIQDQPSPGTPGQTAESIAYDYLGMLISSLVLRFNAGEGAVGWTATMMGKDGGTASPESIAAAEGTPSAPILGWQGSVDFNSSAYGRLVDCEWTFAREIVMQHAANETKEPSFGYAGPLEVTARATVELHSDYELNLWRAGNEFAFKVTLSKGTGASEKTLEIRADKCFFDSPPEIDRGAVNARLNLALRARYDPAAAMLGPVKMTLTNNKSSYAS